MNAHNHSSADLTRNQALVFDALSESVGPLSAYSLLDLLRKEGFRAPLQVYRALDKLIELGLVHRLESLNAFVACQQPECETHATTAFAICENCGHVSEFASEKVAALLADWAKSTSFDLQKTTIELRGMCRDCRSN